MFNKENLSDLAGKYAGQLPRYTSYPTAVELRPTESDSEVVETLRDLRAETKTVSIYVHIPFCPSLCYFCACNKVITKEHEPRQNYLETLEREAKRLVDVSGIDTIPAVQVHLGGGSPSSLDCAQLRQLNSILGENLLLDCSVEKSIEVDPRDLSPDKIEALGALGFQRISFGVQDFDRGVQEYVNRVQPYDLTANTVAAFRNLGTRSVNLDLIYGLPGQTAESFAKTLEQVLTIRPNRIALYGYAHVRQKVKVQKTLEKYGLPSPEERLELFTNALFALQAAGYIYIGLDHFALPDDELAVACANNTLRRNFMGYTTVKGDCLIGLGASSISDTGSMLYQQALNVDEYTNRVGTGSIPVARQLHRSAEDRLRAFIIERVMCSGSIELAELEGAFPSYPDLKEVFSSGLAQLNELSADGLVEIGERSLRVTELGRIFLRQIASVFDAYLPEHVQAQKPAFSQSV